MDRKNVSLFAFMFYVIGVWGIVGPDVCLSSCSTQEEAFHPGDVVRLLVSLPRPLSFVVAMPLNSRNPDGIRHLLDVDLRIRSLFYGPIVVYSHATEYCVSIVHISIRRHNNSGNCSYRSVDSRTSWRFQRHVGYYAVYNS